MTSAHERPAERLSLGLALLPLVVLIASFGGGALAIGLKVEVLIVSMLLAATVAGAIARSQGAGWADIERVTGEKFASVLPVILILLSIGMLIGTWVMSGTIPMLISWGIELVHPRFLALTAFLVTAAMSLGTGTSWGSAGTLGVALMGAAAALDAPLAPVAGAVVSGAYLGDKMSPISDSTNVCALAAHADLYAHIRHMLYTALPSGALALVVFAVAGLRGSAPTVAPETARELVSEIETIFQLNGLVGVLAFIPLLLVLIAIVRRIPPALALAGSSAVAAVIGLTVHGFGLDSAVAAIVSGFDPRLVADLGIDPGTLSDSFVNLVRRGGLNSMAPTLVVVLSAFLLAACLDVSGALARILEALLSTVRSTFGLIAATMAAGATMISLTSHGAVTSLIVGGMFEDAYKRRGLAPVNLSRSLEDSVTVVEALLPWTVSAIFMATTLGVPTVEYAPWAVFCFGGPFFSLLWAALADRVGFGIRRITAYESKGNDPQ